MFGFLNIPNFELIRHDITKPISLSVDEIYNLACPASPVHYQFNPVQTVKTSVHGALNMLDLARECGAKIFQASTSEVYGEPEQHPQSEDYLGRVNPTPSKPRNAPTNTRNYHPKIGSNIGGLTRAASVWGDVMLSPPDRMPGC